MLLVTEPDHYLCKRVSRQNVTHVCVVRRVEVKHNEPQKSDRKQSRGKGEQSSRQSDSKCLV